MEQEKIGSFIRTMRQERGLTQLQLAERLGVTDKAVSKWERCLSFPDIALLQPLADALKVSVAELLAGERNTSGASLSPEAAVADALTYSEAVQVEKRTDWRLWVFLVLSASCLLAALVCLICDLAVNRRYTWFPLVLASLVLGWAVCVLPFIAKKRPVRLALLSLTVGCPPYLLLLSVLLKEPLVWRISLWVVPISLAYLWIAYALCRWLKNRKWLAAGLILLLTGPFTAGVNAAVDRFVAAERNVHEIFCALLLGTACLVVDYALHRRR